MKVLLIRHSTAVGPYEAPTDEMRWLSGAGRARMRHVAALVRDELVPTRIFTSPLARTIQTADLLAEGVGFEGAVEVWPALAAEHGTSAQALAALDHAHDHDVVALVTHVPKVAVLAGHLLGRDRVPEFQTGTVLALERDGRGARELWTLDPERMQIVRR
ncbi:MAG: histidine phosphatase family protein [Sandaracinus sp.]|nr:histidine phosphatase family protein [Sandaracinus sp.]MCB9635006.1 histidine phosphatase family protein [Sandaracinus sp.]